MPKDHISSKNENLAKNFTSLEFLEHEFIMATVTLEDFTTWISAHQSATLPFFFSKTSQEISLLIPSSLEMPKMLRKETGWLSFFVKGEIPFDATSVLAPILTLLGEKKISILAESTFSTDFVFFKKEKLESVIDCLKKKYELDLSKIF